MLDYNAICIKYWYKQTDYYARRLPFKRVLQAHDLYREYVHGY